MEKFDIENFPTSRAAVDMLHSISEGFYQDSYVMKWLLQVEGLEWDSAESILGGGASFAVFPRNSYVGAYVP